MVLVHFTLTDNLGIRVNIELERLNIEQTGSA